jgi:adenosyl cobinamide kinase/adenosyl cobinamide phosphate guanylyltransferase
MRLLVTGPPKSGKSALAERVAEHCQHVVYFATLSETATTRDRIEQHRRRRPADWAIIVASGNVLADIATLASAIIGESLLFVDGVTQYFALVHAFCSRDGTASHEALAACGEIFGDFITAHERWIVVDVSPDCVQRAWSDSTDRGVAAVHERLKRQGLSVTP